MEFVAGEMDSLELGVCERAGIPSQNRTIHLLTEKSLAARARGVKLGDYQRIAAAKRNSTAARAEAVRPSIGRPQVGAGGIRPDSSASGDPPSSVAGIGALDDDGPYARARSRLRLSGVQLDQRPDRRRHAPPSPDASAVAAGETAGDVVATVFGGDPVRDYDGEIVDGHCILP
jgi:hypothetical protein